MHQLPLLFPILKLRSFNKERKEGRETNKKNPRRINKYLSSHFFDHGDERASRMRNPTPNMRDNIIHIHILQYVISLFIYVYSIPIPTMRTLRAYEKKNVDRTSSIPHN